MGSGGTSDEDRRLQTQVLQLKEQLAEEQMLRRQAEAAVEQAAATCSRLQKARDELAAALLAAERRAAEAEEEQLAAEAAAAALEQALREQQLAADASSSSPQPAAPLSPGSEPLESGSRRGEAALDADLEILLAELDQERQRSEELVRTLEAAEREAVAATEKLLRAQQRIKQLEGGGKRGLFGGVRKSASAAALPPDGGGEPADGEEGAAALQQRIAALKASRDKLIAAFDAQAAEVERLSGDNAALAQVGCGWETVAVLMRQQHFVHTLGNAALLAQGSSPRTSRVCPPHSPGADAAAGRCSQVGGAGAGQPGPKRAAEGPAGGKCDVGPAPSSSERRRPRGGGAGRAGGRGHRGGGGGPCRAGRPVPAL